MDAVVIGQQNAHSSRFDLLEAAHVGPQHVRNGDAAILVLIVLHDGDQRAADGDARTVQRMDEQVALAVLVR